MMKLELHNRLSYWKIVRRGKNKVEIGTMRRFPNEAEAQAMPRALEIAALYDEQRKEKK